MITLGLGFVEEVFRTVQRINTSQMGDKTEKDEVRMYRRRRTVLNVRAS